jgi:hypothetical protein
MFELIGIEYEAVRISLGSLSVQAVSNRILQTPSSTQGTGTLNSLELGERQSVALFENPENREDEVFVREVVDASTRLLSSIMTLGTKKLLSFCPIRIFTRIVFASTILLKVWYHNAMSPYRD